MVSAMVRLAAVAVVGVMGDLEAYSGVDQRMVWGEGKEEVEMESV